MSNKHPTPEEIRAKRKLAGLTQKSAAELLHVNVRVWQQWEYAEAKMHPAFWELFKIKNKIGD
jgi:DNA (cytosine-5)-methyltransferase 1